MEATDIAAEEAQARKCLTIMHSLGNDIGGDLEMAADLRRISNEYFDDDKNPDLKRLRKGPDELLEDFRMLILKLVNRAIARGTSLCRDDLFQIGAMGLMRAVRNYRKTPTKSRFSTYAYRWIDGLMRRHDEKVEPSLDEPLQKKSGDEPDLTLVDSLACPGPSALEQLERSELWKKVEGLPRRERIVIACRFMHGMTLAETGEALGGKTREYVRQIESRALRRLRKRLSG